jgi:hypothetical protein
MPLHHQWGEIVHGRNPSDMGLVSIQLWVS